MRILWWILLMGLSMPAMAFNVVGFSRANFGAPSAEESNQEEGAAPRTHTATTYSSRYKFDKGTRGGQTKPGEVSGGQREGTPSAVVKEPTVNISANKKQAKNVSLTPAEKSASAATATQSASQQDSSAGIPPEAAAAMAQLGQVQGMLQELQNMAGDSGGNTQGNAGAMPAGMPDLSSLLGGKAHEKK